ncbi:hypothetical protein P175DRAFT_0499998 [Aspergillus ochraceoroseus IBT 24754]|uniref:Uncharacterized protein n=1 Tax=Aspergillus ochraceoroseus IBT 24754 TaxID=1392256 RepID=A0A2T5M4J0_9EURO|nr:uncharacterized protein P175DRAFT_0499998 [Aspergillus ochraceoroseus IBT 24754]PTU23450.1 hypothetical protein P175DRAFT_0499998 [Aspergillus ochraceoroseus IBT 24754]
MNSTDQRPFFRDPLFPVVQTLTLSPTRISLEMSPFAPFKERIKALVGVIIFVDLPMPPY